MAEEEEEKGFDGIEHFSSLISGGTSHLMTERTGEGAVNMTDNFSDLEGLQQTSEKSPLKIATGYNSARMEIISQRSNQQSDHRQAVGFNTSRTFGDNDQLQSEMESNIDLNASEHNSTLGDVEEQIAYVVCISQERAIGITLQKCQFHYFNFAKMK